MAVLEGALLSLRHAELSQFRKAALFAIGEAEDSTAEAAQLRARHEVLPPVACTRKGLTRAPARAASFCILRAGEQIAIKGRQTDRTM